MINVPVIKFMFRSEWKPLSDALLIGPIYETGELNSANDLTTFLCENSAGMIVVSLRDTSDLIQLATLMKLIKKFADKPTFVKVIVVNFSGNKQFEKAVGKLGLDLLEDKIQTKALRFKIDFMMKSINAQMKKNANVVSNSVKSLENNKNQDKKTIESTAISIAPIECEDDIWILRNEADCKTVLTRWLVRLLGPSPYVASWVDSGNPGIWKFEFKAQNSLLVSGNGSWFYRGDQKPDFIWSENIWSFTGNAFDLFYKDGNDVFSRLKLKEKQLTIAKNSEYAKTKERIIIETFDKDLVFRKEQQANTEKEAFDTEQDKLKNLEGKGKTEAITQGPLSGKGKTDALTQGPLSGKGKTDALTQGPLSGKGKTSNTNTDPLSMDLKPGENSDSTDPLSQKTATSKSSSFWKGKNECEKEGFGEFEAPSDQAIRSGDQLSLENKNNKHEKFYKNHNEAEKFEGKESGHSIKKDGVSDNLKGKTDPSKSSSAAGGSDLNGKGATEQIDSHLTSPGARKEKALAEKAESELSGKSSTDKIQGHLSSENAKKDKSGTAEKEKIEKEISAKAEKEKSASHPSSPNEKKDKLMAEKEKTEKEISTKSEREKSADQSSALNEKKDKSMAEKEKTAKTAAEKMGAHSASPEAKKDKTENELADMPTAEKMARQLAALRAKKDQIEKEKEEKTGRGSGTTASGRTSEGGTDKISSIYSSRTKTKETNGSENLEGKGNVLPFAEKEISLGSKELDDAIQTGSVTSYLTQDSLKVLCHLDDYFDQTIIFTTKENKIVQTKIVILNLNFNYLNKDTSLKFDGEVKQVEADDEGLHYITVEISKDSASAFKSFMKVYNTRQENINLFLKTVKG